MVHCKFNDLADARPPATHYIAARAKLERTLRDRLEGRCLVDQMESKFVLDHRVDHEEVQL